MSRLNIFITPLLILFALVQTTGCSVIFFTLGAVGDGSSPDEDTIGVWQVMSLKSGERVMVDNGSDTTVTGVYVGMDETRTRQYVQKYSEWHSDNSSNLPLPDDSLQVVRASPLRPNVEGTLVGIDPGTIHVRVGDNVEPVSIESIRSITSRRGTTEDGNTLNTWLQSSQAPCMSTLCIAAGVDTHKVPLYDLREIRISNPKNSRWKGLAGGALVDAFLILVALNMDPPFHGSFWGPD